MTEQRLENTRDYFDNIVEPAYRQFVDAEVTFLAVYSMAAGLYHIADWFYYHDEAKIRAKFGSQIKSSGNFWHDIVEKQIPDSGFIRDLNNAAKHVELHFDPCKPKRRGPSTTMRHSTNTSISTSAWGEGHYGQGGYGGAPEARMDEAGHKVSLEPIATALFEFWEVLVDEFYPRQALVSAVDSTTPPTSNS